MSEPIYRLPDLIIHPTPLVEEIAATPWHVAKSRVEDARHKYGVDGAGVVVAIGDSGFDRAHCENMAGGLYGRVAGHFDFTGEGHFDDHGHGSHVAGCILSIAPKCSLLNVKCLGGQGGGGDRGIAASIRKAADEGAVAYNGSFGSSMPSPLILDALEYAAAKGCVPFIAAGNTGRPRDVQWPARSEACLSVSAVDEADRIAPFSSTGPEVDVAWYGVKILSFGRNGGFAVMSGTSMACPMPVGLYTLLVQREIQMFGARKTRTIEGVKEWLRRCCTDAGVPGPDDQFGIGIPNTLKALNGAMEPKPKLPHLEIPLFGDVVIRIPAREGDSFSIGDKTP